MTNESAPRSESNYTAVLIMNGGSAPVAAIRVSSTTFVIAADSGYSHARARNLSVHALIGDFDSLTPEDLAHAERHVPSVYPYPPDKEATDLELALDLAMTMAPDRVVVTGGIGPDDRLDHLVAQLPLLAAPQYRSALVEARLGRAHITVLRPQRTTWIQGAAESLVSIQPIGGECTGVTTRGLRFPLYGDRLSPFSTRGVSNELTEAVAEITIAQGVAVAVQPFARGRIDA